jgi:hypothetical protein
VRRLWFASEKQFDQLQDSLSEIKKALDFELAVNRPILII